MQVFAVFDQGEIEGAGVLHRSPEEARVHDGLAVVGDGDDAGFFHGSDCGQLLARTVSGDGADGEDMHDGRFARALAFTGCVLGMQQMEVKPPAAAAREPLSMVSACSKPGSRRWTCMSMKPGATMSWEASNTSAPAVGRPAAISRIRPSSMATSQMRSSCWEGSITRPFLMMSLLIAPAPVRAQPCVRPLHFPPGSRWRSAWNRRLQRRFRGRDSWGRDALR